jgi:hypothetical protein
MHLRLRTDKRTENTASSILRDADQIENTAAIVECYCVA